MQCWNLTSLCDLSRVSGWAGRCVWSKTWEEEVGRGDRWFLSVVGPHSFLWLFCSCPSSSFWPPPSPSLHPKPPKPTTCSQVIKHTNKENCLCGNMPLWSRHPRETPPLSTVRGRTSQGSQAGSRLRTLNAEGRGKAELLEGFGPVGSWKPGGGWGKGTPKSPGRLRREREKRKSLMFRVTSSFDKIWGLVGPLGFWLSMGERCLLGL